MPKLNFHYALSVHFLRYVLIFATFFSFLDKFLPVKSSAWTRLKSGQDCWIYLHAETEARARSGVGTDTNRIAAGKGSLQMVQELVVQGNWLAAGEVSLRRGEGTLADRS